MSISRRKFFVAIPAAAVAAPAVAMAMAETPIVDVQPHELSEAFWRRAWAQAEINRQRSEALEQIATRHIDEFDDERC